MALTAVKLSRTIKLKLLFDRLKPSVFSLQVMNIEGYVFYNLLEFILVFAIGTNDLFKHRNLKRFSYFYSISTVFCSFLHRPPTYQNSL
jgi:hypothetical protein